jgi:hypothetical protein
MDFRGHLRLPGDAGTGIPVVLRVDDIYIVITSAGEELGSWRADEMSVERIFSNQFSLDLAGEPMVFVAADALGFAYEGVAAIEELQARLTKRRVFRKKKAAAKTAPEEPVIASEVVEPQPLWTPPASKPASKPAASDEPAPVTADSPEPVQRQLDREEAAPSDSRVVYPSARTAEPQPVVETEPVVVEPESAPEPVAESPVTAEREPAPFEVEFEVEEVGLATSGGSWIEPESASPEPTTEPAPHPPWEPEPQPELEPKPEVELLPEVEIPAAEDDVLEIEDYQPAAAAFVETFVAPAGEAVPSEGAEEAAVEPEAELHRHEFVTEPERFAEPVFEPVADPEPQPEVAEAEPSKVDAPNGYRSSQEKKPSLFRWQREKKPAPHDHAYGEPKTIGGLKRSVCEICGHVTFSGEDAYQGW